MNDSDDNTSRYRSEESVIKRHKLLLTDIKYVW
jgi:hypothetical protein